MNNTTHLKFLNQFQLSLPQNYHPETQTRTAHLIQQPLRQAAVLIGVVPRAEGLQVIFTKRAPHLKNHPNQVSFPGGKYELTDTSLAQTAMREAFEEVGIQFEQINIIGQLPELPTISKFTVTPYLAFIDPNYQTIIDKNEVTEVFEVPLDYVLNPNNLLSELFDVPKRDPIETYRHRVFALPYQQHFIWGMTAQIIEALQRQLSSFRS